MRVNFCGGNNLATCTDAMAAGLKPVPQAHYVDSNAPAPGSWQEEVFLIMKKEAESFELEEQ